LFRSHCAAFVPSGATRLRDDAIAFAALAESIVREERITPVWAADVLAYEAGWLTAVAPSRRLTVSRLGYSPTDLIAAANRRNRNSPAPRPTLAFWVRRSAGSRVRSGWISLPAWLSSCRVTAGWNPLGVSE
jgi:hypothetical protein